MTRRSRSALLWTALAALLVALSTTAQAAVAAPARPVAPVMSPAGVFCDYAHHVPGHPAPARPATGTARPAYLAFH